MATFASPTGFSSPAGLPPAARLLVALLRRVEHGRLVVETPRGERLAFGSGDHGPAAVLRVRDWRMAARTLRGGDVGFAESHLDGEWDSPDLVRLLTVIAANQAALERAREGAKYARQADKYLRDNPWPFVAGGIIAGVLATLWWSQRRF